MASELCLTTKQCVHLFLSLMYNYDESYTTINLWQLICGFNALGIVTISDAVHVYNMVWLFFFV